MNLLKPKDLKGISLKVVSSKGKCKYHPKVGQRVSLLRSIPKGMCPYLYVAAYPYALSLLYDAEFSWRKKIDKDTVVAQCCRPFNQMAFEVKRIANPKINKILLEKFEEERFKIYIKLIEKKGKKSDCSDCLGYKSMIVGNTFEFNRGDLPEICPAAFNSFFPILVEIMNTKKWAVRKFACPDPKTDVIFEVTKNETPTRRK